MTSLAVSLHGVRVLDPDAERMVAAAGGDLDAFNGIVASHQDILYGLAVWATGDPTLAEDGSRTACSGPMRAPASTVASGGRSTLDLV